MVWMSETLQQLRHSQTNLIIPGFHGHQKRKRLQTQLNSKITANLITAGDRGRTFLRLSNTDGKKAGGLTLFSEPTFEPSYGYTSNVLKLLYSL